MSDLLYNEWFVTNNVIDFYQFNLVCSIFFSRYILDSIDGWLRSQSYTLKWINSILIKSSWVTFGLFSRRYFKLTLVNAFSRWPSKCLCQPEIFVWRSYCASCVVAIRLRVSLADFNAFQISGNCSSTGFLRISVYIYCFDRIYTYINLCIHLSIYLCNL